MSPNATNILKKTINHTKNIQSKDIEKLPYPIWVSDDVKKEVAEELSDYYITKLNIMAYVLCLINYINNKIISVKNITKKT